MGQVAICYALVTSVVLNLGGLPRRLETLGWQRPVYVRGAVCPDGPAVAIVGARAASAEGMERAQRVARHLAERHVHVVSGGAVGIDGAAHRGALAGGGTTTIVLGNGLDIAYPARHASLFEQALAHGGGLMGIVPDGVEPRPALFPQRNKLISALVDAVVVIEADVRSGSLSTAASALTQQRLVAAWPGSPGCDRLLARGAAIVESLADVDRIVDGQARMPIRPAFDPDVQRVADAVAAGAGDVDAICMRTGLPVRAVLRALPLLERYS